MSLSLYNEVWTKVQQGSRVRCKDANGAVHTGTVVRFTAPTDYIRVRDEAGVELEVYVEQIFELLG